MPHKVALLNHVQMRAAAAKLMGIPPKDVLNVLATVNGFEILLRNESQVMPAYLKENQRESLP